MRVCRICQVRRRLAGVVAGGVDVFARLRPRRDTPSSSIKGESQAAATEPTLDLETLSLCEVDFRLLELSRGPDALESRESLLRS